MDYHAGWGTVRGREIDRSGYKADDRQMALIGVAVVVVLGSALRDLAFRIHMRRAVIVMQSLMKVVMRQTPAFFQADGVGQRRLDQQKAENQDREIPHRCNLPFRRDGDKQR